MGAWSRAEPHHKLREKYLEFRFRCREWTLIFFSLYLTLLQFYPLLLGRFLWINSVIFSRVDNGLLAAEVPFFPEVPDSQIPDLQEERRLIPGETRRNFGEKEEGKRRSVTTCHNTM